MKLTRREFLQSSAGIAGIVSLSASLENCATNDNYRELKCTLGDRWERMPYRERKRTLKIWDKELNEFDRAEFMSIYADPDKAYSELGDESKKLVDFCLKTVNTSFFKEHEVYKYVEQISNYAPLMDINNLTKSDIIFIDYFLGKAVAASMTIG